jgi:HEAT repeat protein
MKIVKTMMGMGGLALVLGVMGGVPEATAQRIDREARVRAERAAAVGHLAALVAERGAAASQRIALRAQEREVRALRDDEIRRYQEAVLSLELQEDPANDLYRQAREYLRQREYMEAAARFAEIRAQYAESGYVPDSYYYEAFALQRSGGEEQMRMALELLLQQREVYPDATTSQDAAALMARIEAQLARRGDATAYRQTRARAAQECGEQDEVRMAALSALINMDPERARPILMEVLADRDACSAELRQQAIFLLSQDMSPETVDLLVDLALNNPDPNPEVRTQAVFWLGQSDSDEARAAVRQVLEQAEDRELQSQALFALSQSDDDETMDLLLDYVRRTDIDPEVRQNAIFYISQHDSEAAGPVLIEIYPTLGAELQQQVLFALSQVDDDQSRAFLRERAMDTGENNEVRQQALFWLVQAGEGMTMDELTNVYRTTQDMELKQHIIFLSTQIEDDEGAVDFLMTVAQDESNPELQEQAVFWLGQSDDPRAAEFLLDLIRKR